MQLEPKRPKILRSTSQNYFFKVCNSKNFKSPDSFPSINSAIISDPLLGPSVDWLHSGAQTLSRLQTSDLDRSDSASCRGRDLECIRQRLRHCASSRVCRDSEIAKFTRFHLTQNIICRRGKTLQSKKVAVVATRKLLILYFIVWYKIMKTCHFTVCFF